jgi:uncharacterized protein
MITEEDRARVLELARRTVVAAASGEEMPDVPDGEIFSKKGGVFVTLKKDGSLRGCIGHFIGVGTLGETIIEMAASAAIRDPRFSPVRRDELEDIAIDVSLLSEMTEASPDKVVPGTHGIFLKYGFRSGTLLPQVATEEGWDRETFLSHTCLKAGLPMDCWKRDGVQIFTYTAEVFGEKKEGAERL